MTLKEFIQYYDLSDYYADLEPEEGCSSDHAFTYLLDKAANQGIPISDVNTVDYDSVIYADYYNWSRNR